MSAPTADDAAIRAVHAADFVGAVKHADDGSIPFDTLRRFGLGTGDVPIVPNMHAAAAHIAGATLRAAELVMSGDVTRAFSIAGAWRSRPAARGVGLVACSARVRRLDGHW